MAKTDTKINKKGRAFLYTSGSGLVPLSSLGRYEKIAKDSKQPKDDTKHRGQFGLVSYPYPPESFLRMYEANPIFARCVDQTAIDVAGLGWTLQLREGKQESQQELDGLNAFLKAPNPNENFRSILKKLMIDWGAVGWFGLEIVRSQDDKVAEVYQVPAHTFKIHKGKNKFMQQRGQKRVWFAKYGYPKSVSMKDGKESTSLPKKQRAHELIYVMNHYPLSDFYGSPNILPATGDMMGLFGQRDYNLAFFANFGIPSAIVTLSGEWEDDAEKVIGKFLNDEFKGSENQHRTLVLTERPECKVEYTPLVTEIKEGHFKLYEQARKENVMTAYSMPPERIGIRIVGKLGGNVAEEATRIYFQGVVWPLQLDLEDMINDMLLQSETYSFKFDKVDLRDLDILSKRLQDEIAAGMRTPNEAREILGLDPYTDGDEFFMNPSFLPVGSVGDDE